MHGHVLGGLVIEHDGEFIAAQACHGVGFAHAGLQTMRHLDQQLIARLMPERIVDELEFVQIDVGHSHPPLVALGIAHCLVQTVNQQVAVGQAGQSVMPGAKTEQIALALLLQMQLHADTDFFGGNRLDQIIRAAQLEGHKLVAHLVPL